jgi:SHS2 domain-containing protein
MPYSWVEHTAELEVDLEAESERGLFEAGFEAMLELLAFDGEPEEPLSVDVAIPGRDRATLIADWLGELAFLGETLGLVPERLRHLELADTGLRATVEGRKGNPPHLVKAATYHRLRFERAGGGWRARVVLDV